MPQERLYRFGSREYTIEQIPKLYDLGRIFDEAVALDADSRFERIRNLLIHQYEVVIQENIKNLWLTKPFRYLLREQNGHISVRDEYYIDNDLLTLSTIGWINGVGYKSTKTGMADYWEFFEQVANENGGIPDYQKHWEQDFILSYRETLEENHQPELGDIFVERFWKEAHQTYLLYKELEKILHLSHALIDQLTTPPDMPWLVQVMPATDAHPGSRCFINVYHPEPQPDGSLQLIKMGWFTKKSLGKLSILLTQLTGRYVAPTENALMGTTAVVSRQVSSPQEMMKYVAGILQDGNSARQFDNTQRRLNQQRHSVESAAELTARIIIEEMSLSSEGRDARLSAFLELIINPLLFNKEIKVNEIYEKYHQELDRASTSMEGLGGFNRDRLVRSLLSDMPSLLFETGGFFAKMVHGIGGYTLCGALSAGGLGTGGQMFQRLQGAGGRLGVSAGGHEAKCPPKLCPFHSPPVLVPDGAAHCPTCGRDKNGKVVHQHHESEPDGSGAPDTPNDALDVQGERGFHTVPNLTELIGSFVGLNMTRTTT